MQVRQAKFEDLKGKTIAAIDSINDGSVLSFLMSDGKIYRMYHYNDCCESVYIEDICGDINDLLESPILLAEEVTEELEDLKPDDERLKLYYESATWTFYKLSTIKGSVTIRWCGSSNGYYSERVDFEEVY